MYTFYCTIQKTGNLSGNLVMNQGKLDIASNKLILGAFRWCIVSNQSMAAQGLTLVVDERGAVTGIGFARSNEQEGAQSYDLSGRRLNGQSSRGQLRIVNGQKTF